MLHQSPRRRTKLSKEREKEELIKWIRDLDDESILGSMIVVEGKRDVEALRAVGIRGEVVVYRTVEELVERVRERGVKRVILLLDPDDEGRRMTQRVVKHLEGDVRSIDLTYWNRLKKFKHLGINSVESIPGALKRLVE